MVLVTGSTDTTSMQANVDGVNGDDLVFLGTDNWTSNIYPFSGSGDGTLNRVHQVNPNKDEGPLTHALLDVNGDGVMDLLQNHLGVYNRSFIGLGTTSGTFDFSRVSQDHPAVDDWSQFKLLVGDFNGDGQDDIVYNSAGSSNDIYVGLAKE